MSAVLADVVGEDGRRDATIPKAPHAVDDDAAVHLVVRHRAEHLAHIERHPCCLGLGNDLRQRVGERQLAALEPVPGVVRVGAVGAEDDPTSTSGSTPWPTGVGVRGGERRRREDPAVVEDHRVDPGRRHRP